MPGEPELDVNLVNIIKIVKRKYEYANSCAGPRRGACCIRCNTVCADQRQSHGVPEILATYFVEEFIQLATSSLNEYDDALK